MKAQEGSKCANTAMNVVKATDQLKVVVMENNFFLCPLLILCPHH